MPPKKFPSLFPFIRHATLGLLVASLAACGGGDAAAPASPETPTSPAPEVAAPVIPPLVLPTCSAAVPGGAPLTNIGTIQGTGSVSAMVSQTVTIRGVVVGEFQNQATNQLGGFFVQQAVPDSDPLTSEGIFVFAPSADKVNPGDYVQVSGVVGEFGGVADSITQLGGTVTVSVCGGGITLAPAQVTFPVADATALERYEGMLVQFTQTLGVTEEFELGRFGQMVLGLGGRQFHPNNGNVVVTNAQNLLARIVLDDGSSTQNPNPIPYLSAIGTTGTRRMGDTAQNLTGVLSHNFGSYRLHPTVAPVFAAANPRPAIAPVLSGTLKVASFNVLNYFTTLNQRGANSAAEFTRQRAKIVEAIAGLDADVLGLMEIENTDVATSDLVAALNARMGAGTYAAVNSGTFGTDLIKVDILFKPARVNRVGGVVLPTGADLANYTAASGRPPLAQRFSTVANNGGFWFVVNHFKSKGSCPASGDVDLGQGCWNAARTVQAGALNNFVATLKAQGENDVLMMGDINSYLLEDPTVALEGAGNESLLKRMPANDRYTYVFGGETGALDHAYASATLRAQVNSVGVWHINADEPSVLDYNTEFKTDDRYAATPFRASDHDPVMVGLTLTADAVVTLPVLGVSFPATAQATQPYALNITEATPGGTATLASLSVNWGDGSGLTSAPGAGTVTHTFAAAGTFTVVVTFTNSSAQAASQSAVVNVSAAPVAGGAPDLFFSEYIEGSSNNKAIEIYNPTTLTVNLSAYTVKLYSNGTTTVTNLHVLSGSLAPGAVLVLANNSAAVAFKPVGSITTTVANFNGDDALTLENTGVVIDRIGQQGVDPGTEWAASGVSTLNSTIRRKPAIKVGDANATAPFDPSAQWDSFPIDTSDGLGAHTVTP